MLDVMEILAVIWCYNIVSYSYQDCLLHDSLMPDITSSYDFFRSSFKCLLCYVIFPSCMGILGHVQYVSLSFHFYCSCAWHIPLVKHFLPSKVLVAMQLICLALRIMLAHTGYTEYNPPHTTQTAALSLHPVVVKILIVWKRHLSTILFYNNERLLQLCTTLSPDKRSNIKKYWQILSWSPILSPSCLSVCIPACQIWLCNITHVLWIITEKKIKKYSFV